jgi:hypothetical protein
MKKNVYKKGSSDSSLQDLVEEIATTATDAQFEKFWVKEKEIPEEIAINKGDLGKHIKDIASLFGVKSATKACAEINDKYTTGYTIQEIEKVWSILDAEWKSRQVIEEPEIPVEG